MIGKIRSVQDSWVMKLILILTALSFMSLFGISGYVSSTTSNKPVIKVDDLVITQAQISNIYNQEVQMAKNLFGDNLDMNENIRNSLLQGIVQKELSNAILEKTAEDNNVHISDALIKKIISSQPDFMDETGKFSAVKMRRLLSASGWTEQKYIDTLRKDIKKLHLVQNVVEGVNIPAYMAEYLFKADNQKKVFKYINIAPENMKIDRKISQEEKEQYYNDFAAQFIEPENRDVSFISLSAKDIAGNMQISNEEIEQYYNDNQDQFVTPETRNVLQMVFPDKDAADKAYGKVKNGADFYAVAKSDANQDKGATELGYVQKDMLIGDMGEIMFDLSKGQISEPIKSDFGWHIMKVTDIRPMKKTSLESAKSKIAETLRKEHSDDAESNLIAKIEDEIGGGKDIKAIAEELKAPVLVVKALNENGKYASVSGGYESIVKSEDFIETAFSYNPHEVSQVFETDEGYAILSIDNVTETRQKSMDEVSDEIEKMWEINEKNAISQEVVNDVVHDIENGDSIESVAKRFGLTVNTTQPLKKNDTFNGFSMLQVQDLFREDIGSPKAISDDNHQVVVVPTKVINSTAPLSRGDVDNIRKQAGAETAQEMAQQLINGYGSNYRVKVKYKALGFID